MVKIILFSVALWLAGCAETSNYGNTGQSTDTGTGADNYDPRYHTGSSGSTFPNSSCPAAGKWGGVTCGSNSDKDEGFLNFLSNGTDITSDKSIGTISCSPSNTGGILFRMKVVLNAPFDPSGQNNNNLTMQIGSSTFEIVIHDSLKEHQPISAIFEGLSGEIDGNTAKLDFIYSGTEITTKKGNTFHSGRKQLKLEGTFNAEIFSGTVYFENEKYWDGRTPGAKGTLGQFKISTCSVFTSN
jgi:hypothetical protein